MAAPPQSGRATVTLMRALRIRLFQSVSLIIPLPWPFIGGRPAEQRTQPLGGTELEDPGAAFFAHVEAAEAGQRHTFARLERLVERLGKAIGPPGGGGLVGLHVRGQAADEFALGYAHRHTQPPAVAARA